MTCQSQIDAKIGPTPLPYRPLPTQAPWSFQSAMSLISPIRPIRSEIQVIPRFPERRSPDPARCASSNQNSSKSGKIKVNQTKSRYPHSPRALSPEDQLPAQFCLLNSGFWLLPLVPQNPFKNAKIKPNQTKSGHPYPQKALNSENLSRARFPFLAPEFWLLASTLKTPMNSQKSNLIQPNPTKKISLNPNHPFMGKFCRSSQCGLPRPRCRRSARLNSFAGVAASVRLP
jgi:hypothetical protein